MQTRLVLTLCLFVVGAVLTPSAAPQELAAVPRMSQADWLTLMPAGQVVSLDGRSAAAYQAGPLPGARSMPWQEVGQRVQPRPTDKPSVAYCSGTDAPTSARAARH